MPTSHMPRAEVDITPQLVARLIQSQHPDLAGVAITPLAEGWDNTSFLVGDLWVARLPRRSSAAALITHEQKWLPILAERVHLPIPVPQYVGRPGAGYPWPWSIHRFLPGVSAALGEPDDPATTAATLGRFLGELHQAAPPDAPPNPYRGVPLSTRDEATREHLEQLVGHDRLAIGRLASLWSETLSLPEYDDAPVWLHGDLHPDNLLVDDGRLVAVVDFGDITSGDPATDLAVAWMLLPPEVHTAFVEAYGGVNATLWGRARGWAMTLGLSYLRYSADNPTMARIGERTLAAVIDD